MSKKNNHTIQQTLVFQDGSSSTKTLCPETDPIGSTFHSCWVGDSQRGYVEIHPKKDKMLQIEVDQKTGTVKLCGFWKNLETVAINSIELHF